MNPKKQSEPENTLVPLPTRLQPAGRLEPEITCIMFDLYGTLFISGSGDIDVSRRDAAQSNDALTHLLRRFNLDRPPDAMLTAYLKTIEAEHARLRGKGIDYPEVKIDRIWQQVLGFTDRAVAREFAEAFEQLANPTAPMPHLTALLTACRKAHLQMGIISNAQFYTPLLFKRHLKVNTATCGFNPDFVFYSYRHGYAKPSLYMFKAARDRLAARNIAPHQTLYVGNDMRNDIYPAHQIGFQAALFAGDARSLRLRSSDPRCAGLSPDLTVTGLDQLIPHLARTRATGHHPGKGRGPGSKR